MALEVTKNEWHGQKIVVSKHHGVSWSDQERNKDDGESDDDDALAHPPSPQARPYFERDPMLDQLVAEELHKRQKINKCGSMDTWIPVQEGEMISSV